MRDMDEKTYVAGWFFWIVGLLLIVGVIITVMSYSGIFTKTLVENAVFQNSYQKQNADASAHLAYTAELAEIQHQLSSNGLSEDAKRNLEAKAASIRVLLNSK